VPGGEPQMNTDGHRSIAVLIGTKSPLAAVGDGQGEGDGEGPQRRL
jgi:hypothetical protein